MWYQKLLEFEAEKEILWKLLSSVAKKRRRVFALFKSIFLRNRSLSNAWWFYGKKQKKWEGKSVFNWKLIKWNEMCCAADNHNYMCHTCAKEFSDSNFK